MKAKKIKDRPPKTTDLCGIAPDDAMKRAALIFDKLYVSIDKLNEENEIPPDMTFCMVAGEFNSLDFANKSGELKRIKSTLISREIGKGSTYQFLFELPLRHIVSAYSKIGINMVPFYPSNNLLEQEFPEGIGRAVVATLHNLPIISEAQVSWAQIRHFRDDPESIAKYRALRTWLHAGLESTSVSHATDLIAKKIDDYQWALQKHGLQTRIGFLRELLAFDCAFPTAASFGVTSAVAGPIVGALAAGLVVTAKLTAFIAERRIEYQDLCRGPNSEIAILSDIEREFGE